jgi:chromosome segregation ATPase
MTDEDRLLLNELKAGVQRLFNEYEKLKSDNEVLMRNITLLSGKISGLEHEKNELNRQYENMKIANRILSGEDVDGEAKKRINKLVREIDKCIALLNSNER